MQFSISLLKLLLFFTNSEFLLVDVSVQIRQQYKNGERNWKKLYLKTKFSFIVVRASASFL